MLVWLGAKAGIEFAAENGDGLIKGAGWRLFETTVNRLHSAVGLEPSWAFQSWIPVGTKGTALPIDPLEAYKWWTMVDAQAAAHWLWFTVMAIILVGAGLAVLPILLRFMLEHRLTDLNYKQITIPTGLGCFIWLLHIIQLVLLEGAGTVMGVELAVRTAYAPYFAAISIVFVAGWLDDTVGDRTVKGWKGHWRKWRQDRTFTTGWLKAGGTGCAALVAVASIGSASLWLASLQVALLLLMTNALNLLDLKSFLVLCAALVLFVPSGLPLWLLLPSVVGAIVLLPGDLQARHMLGDAGANMLGFAAGFGLIGCAPVWVLALTVGLLLGLHKFAEKRSISAWIDAHRLLNWLDRLGRA
jgi:hypothetical protein